MVTQSWLSTAKTNLGFYQHSYIKGVVLAAFDQSERSISLVIYESSSTQNDPCECHPHQSDDDKNLTANATLLQIRWDSSATNHESGDFSHTAATFILFLNALSMLLFVFKVHFKDLKR